MYGSCEEDMGMIILIDFIAGRGFDPPKEWVFLQKSYHLLQLSILNEESDK